MKRGIDYVGGYVMTKSGVLGIGYIGLSLVFALLICSCAPIPTPIPISYDFIGTWNHQPDTLTYINYDQHIKLTFPNDKWRVYTKPNEHLKRRWKNPWKEASSYHVLWAFVPDWSHPELTMVFQIEPVKGHRLRIEADTTLDEYTALIKSGMKIGKDEAIDSKVIQRKDRKIGVVTMKRYRRMWLYTFFKEKDRFSFLLFICAEGLFESNKDQFWAIVDSYEYLEQANYTMLAISCDTRLSTPWLRQSGARHSTDSRCIRKFRREAKR